MARARSGGGTGAGRSAFGRLLRVILLALLVAFAIGFTVGTLIRRRLDEPVRYIGARPAAEARGAATGRYATGADAEAPRPVGIRPQRRTQATSSTC